jgi:hypothetical protein
MRMQGVRVSEDFISVAGYRKQNNMALAMPEAILLLDKRLLL